MAFSLPFHKARRHGTLGAGGLAHFVHDGISDSLYVLLPLWAEAFGLSMAQVGLLKTCYSSALASLQLPLGMLAERWGERAILAASTVLAGLALTALALAGGFGTLVAGLIVLGLASSAQHPLASAIVSRGYGTTSRRAALGTYNFAGDLGKVAIPPLVAFGAVLFTWQGSVIAYGGLVALAGLALFVLLGRLGAGQPQMHHPRSEEPMPRGWGLRQPLGFTLLSSIGVLDIMCRGGFLTFLPFALLAKGADIEWVGIALGLVLAGGAAGKLVCGLAAERVGVIRLVLLTELSTALGIGALVLLPLGWSLAILPAVGLALNGTSSLLYGTVGDFVDPARQSRAFGLFYTLSLGAGAVSPLLFGMISDATGINVALLLIASLALMTLPLALAMRPLLRPG
ncbi:MAG: MFS transporter [Pseudomonadota bacterium]